jgi:AcrR family transcriptional regulator
MPANPRRTRIDARQNRERLLEVAARAFAEEGLDATPVSIAKQAGVGVGTLYRHFPTREALIDAAYRNELARVCDQAAHLIARHTAAEATRAWMTHFLDYATAKRGMSEALNTVIASGADPYAASRDLLSGAVGALLDAGARDGTLRTDLSREDVLLAMSGIAQSTGQYGTRDQAARLTNLLMDGLTTGTAATAG